jgi:hypothetical protein
LEQTHHLVKLNECALVTRSFAGEKIVDVRRNQASAGPDTDLTGRIIETAEALHDEMVATLQELVRIPSLTGAEAAVQDAVEAVMRRFGLTIDRWEPNAAELAPFAEHVGAFETLTGRPNVVGTWRGSGSGRSLILNAHIDTVETGDCALWTHEPFGAEIDHDRLYGRGSCDMKAGLVANLFAVRILQSLGYRPRGDVVVESVVSEEDGGAGTRSDHHRADKDVNRAGAGRLARLSDPRAGPLSACGRAQRGRQRHREGLGHSLGVARF